jgi:iron uptake system component EfeO
VLLVGCTTKVDAEDAGVVDVDSGDDRCVLSSTKAPAGPLTFRVTNSGGKVTEFYLLAEDGLRIVGEVENIGPGLTRDLVVAAPQGSYVTACKPGMKGEGIRDPFTVTESGEKVVLEGDEAKLVAQANAAYAAYVEDQSAQLLEKTARFVRLYKAGDDDSARALYAPARVHWERIETVAESFGDLDPRMDAREADLEEGQPWSGWHRIEKDLWPQRAVGYVALTPAERAIVANQLLADTKTLDRRVRTLTYTADQIANGSRGLLEEVALGKVTGEEEYWSRTDLWDFQANVDGARVAFDGVRPTVERRDAELVRTIVAEFDDLQRLLDGHRRGDGFVTYDQLSRAQVKQLSDAVNALSEPLSRLTAVVVGATGTS